MTVKKTTLKQAVKAAIRNNTKLIPVHGLYCVNVKKDHREDKDLYGRSIVWLTITVKCRKRKKTDK